VAVGVWWRRLEPHVMEIHGFHAVLHYSLGRHGDYFSMLSRESVAGTPPPTNEEELAPQPEGACCAQCPCKGRCTVSRAESAPGTASRMKPPYHPMHRGWLRQWIRRDSLTAGRCWRSRHQRA
jgi:hypothetical protein